MQNFIQVPNFMKTSFKHGGGQTIQQVGFNKGHRAPQLKLSILN